MKKIINYIFVFLGLVLIACTSSKTATTTYSLEGDWQLNYITGPRIAFDGLYPEKKPTIKFDLKQNKVTGNNSCNQYFGTLLVDGNKLNFNDAKMGMTMMACPGNGDSQYMETLKKIESYTITEEGKTLNFLIGNVVMMRFSKIEL